MLPSGSGQARPDSWAVLDLTEVALELTRAYVRQHVLQRIASGQKMIDFKTQYALAEIKTDITVGESSMDSYLIKLHEKDAPL